jgi:hypothetical protein
MAQTKKDFNSIPKKVEIFGRTLYTIDDSDRLNLLKIFGEARYGVNHIALSTRLNDREVSTEELKLTYLHEMLHFILNFTGYESIIQTNSKIDLEQFIELMSAAIYQYEKTAKY